MPRLPAAAVTSLVVTSLMMFAACSSSASDQAAAPDSSTPDGSTPAASSSPAETSAIGTAELPTESVPITDAVSNDEQQFPDVLSAQARESNGAWTFDVTLSSPYDSPERYADAWRVVGPDGTEYGLRILGHDHANEQPFTRSQSGIVIPDDIDVVTIEARDLVFGWGGQSFELSLR